MNVKSVLRTWINVQRFLSQIVKTKIYIFFQFIDSFQFMIASLEKLEENLTPDQFSILRDNFLNGASCYY